MKIFKHFKGLLLGLLLIALGISFDLKDYSIIRFIDYLFWPIVIFVFLGALFVFRKKIFVIFFLIGFTCSAFAGTNTTEICNYYHSYKQKIDQYRKNHFKEDEPCDEAIWEKARQESEEYKTSLVDFVIPGAVIAKKATEWYDGSCANDLMAICSEYQRRHPETVTKTVPVILNESVGKSASSENSSSCWPCDMGYVVFTVIQNLASNLSDVMAKVSLTILLLVTAFWLLFKATGMVLTSKGGTFFNQVARGLLGVIIVVFLLGNNGKYLTILYSRFLTPVINIGLHISVRIQSSVGMDSAYFQSTMGKPFYKEVEEKSKSVLKGIKQNNFMDYCSYSSSSSSTSSSNTISEFLGSITQKVFPGLGTRFPGLTSVAPEKTLLSDELKADFLCLTQKIYYQSRPFIAIGQSLVSFASNDTKTLPKSSFPRFPSDILMWLIGVSLIILFSYFSFLVAFRIIDIFLRMGFVLVLMPLFVAAIVFPVTRSFTKKGWTFLFQIIVEFIGLAISASFIMILLENVVFPQKDALMSAIVADYSKDYGKNLLNVIAGEGTLSFIFMLITVVFMGEKLLKSFPIIIASLFEVSDSSKGQTLIGGTISSFATGTMKLYDSAKKAAQTVAKNPHKTKETKAKDAEKELQEKKKKLADEKKNLEQAKLKAAQMRGTGKEGEAKKEVTQKENDVSKAQKEVDIAQKKADFMRKEAEKEKQKTAPSQSAYSARRFSKDTANAFRSGGSKTAQAIDSFGSKVGGILMKNGLGRLVGVPLVLGTKALSTGVRMGAKATEVGIKGVGLAAAGVQAVVGQKSSPKKPASKAPPPPPPKP